jgi:hypothetical protein
LSERFGGTGGRRSRFKVLLIDGLLIVLNAWRLISWQTGAPRLIFAAEQVQFAEAS